jgi:hypothetical protein
MPQWRIDLIGKKLQHVGTIEAATEREAIEAAVKDPGVAPALRGKLIATRIDKSRIE